MAKKKAEDKADIPKAKEIKAVVDRCKKFRAEAYDADKDNRKQMVDDLKFAALDQWPEEIKSARNGRLMLTLDKTGQGVKAVIGDMRDNRPSVKVMPVDDNADIETAKVLAGLINTIEQTSNATWIYLNAGAFQTKCGFGVWRIMNEYASHDVFEQDLYIRRIKNPLNWWFDPRANEMTKHDGRYVIGLNQMHKTDFKSEYPEVSASDVDELFTGEGFGDWISDEDVIFAEYYERIPKKKTICLLSNGHTIAKDELDEYANEMMQLNGLMVVKEREADSYEIHYWKVTGNTAFDHQVLPYQYYPVIPVYGEVENIEGEEKIRGLIRPAKDPQRLYNYVSSADVEQMALQPKAPFIGTARMFAKFKNLWNRANKDNLPYLPYSVDKDAPSMRPERSQPPVASSGYIQRAQIAEGDIKSAMGVHEASFGQESNAVSGKAKLIERQSGITTNSEYMFNLAMSIEHTGRVLVDMIPYFYDTTRIVRIAGEDGIEEQVTINKPFMNKDGKQITHDLTRGKYDVRFSVGPSYKTKREQSVDTLFALAQSDPRVMEFAGDLIAKNLDIPHADELEARYRKLLPPGLVEEKDPEKKAQMDQAAQQAEQQQNQLMGIQIQDTLSQIEERKSKVELNQAKTAETVAGIDMDKQKLLQDFLAAMASPSQTAQ
jgi:hypothetical protein